MEYVAGETLEHAVPRKGLPCGAHSDSVGTIAAVPAAVATVSQWVAIWQDPVDTTRRAVTVTRIWFSAHQPA